MSYALSWLADVLRAGGCNVCDEAANVGDWKNRGHGDFGPAKGVLLHDTAGRPPPNDHPSLQTVIAGRPDLGGPLCNLYLSRSGVFYPIAAGKGWHAGDGEWGTCKRTPGPIPGTWVSHGNSQLIGIEMESDGTDEPWLPPIFHAAHTGVVALLRHIGAGPMMCAGHKEYALPRGRKIDPDFPMPEFRESLAPYFTGR